MPLTTHLTLDLTDDAATEAEIVRFYNLDTDDDIAAMQAHLVAELKDLYDAESRIVESLANVPDSTDAFSLYESRIYHLREIRENAQRLEKILNTLRLPLGEMACEAGESHGCNETAGALGTIYST